MTRPAHVPVKTAIRVAASACAQGISSIAYLSFSHELAYAAPPATTQCAQGLRGRRPICQLYARRRGAVRHPGRGEPSGEGAGVGTRNQALQPRPATVDDHRCRPRVPGDCARCVRPHRRGTECLVQRQSSGTLTVTTSPDFAAKWLVQRLGRLGESHPEIDLRLSATMHHVDFAREDVDIAIRHGDGHWPGLNVTRLCSEHLFAVCSPNLASGLKRPSDVLKLPLLHLDDHGAWSAWFEAAGISADHAIHGPILNRASMLIDAAADGQGLALARTTLAAWDLIHKRLVRPLPVALPLSKSYWIVCPKATEGLPKLTAFRDWLLAEASDDLHRLDVLALNR